MSIELYRLIELEVEISKFVVNINLIETKLSAIFNNFPPDSKTLGNRQIIKDNLKQIDSISFTLMDYLKNFIKIYYETLCLSVLAGEFIYEENFNTYFRKNQFALNKCSGAINNIGIVVDSVSYSAYSKSHIENIQQSNFKLSNLIKNYGYFFNLMKDSLKGYDFIRLACNKKYLNFENETAYENLYHSSLYFIQKLNDNNENVFSAPDELNICHSKFSKLFDMVLNITVFEFEYSFDKEFLSKLLLNFNSNTEILKKSDYDDLVKVLLLEKQNFMLKKIQLTLKKHEINYTFQNLDQKITTSITFH